MAFNHNSLTADFGQPYVRFILQGLSDDGSARAFAARMYPFSQLVLSGWELQSLGPEFTSMSRRALRSQLKELATDSSAREAFMSDHDKALARLRKVP